MQKKYNFFLNPPPPPPPFGNLSLFRHLLSLPTLSCLDKASAMTTPRPRVTLSAVKSFQFDSKNITEDGVALCVLGHVMGLELAQTPAGLQASGFVYSKRSVITIWRTRLTIGIEGENEFSCACATRSVLSRIRVPPLSSHISWCLQSIESLLSCSGPSVCRPLHLFALQIGPRKKWNWR